MLLIVGLGNPGTRYLLTRHNIGFMTLDQFIKGVGSVPSKEEFDALTCRFSMDGKDVLFAKPMNYMNNSGDSVAGLINFYKIPLTDLLVVHDDIDQQFGGIKFQQNRGAGGHNGIKSISEKLGSQDYARLKLGVGRPPIPNMEIADWVLQKFSVEEQPELPDFLNIAGDALESFIFNGLSKSAGEFNRKHFTEVGDAGPMNQ